MEAVEARPGKRGRAAARPGGAAEPEAKRRALALSPAPWPPQPQQQHPASRIYRVSRASGGKDRHSKVYTAKGIRDRRVRLSVATAIQFYDLQDRLGYDQPSKAIEWLIEAAADAIDKLPSLDAAAGFPAHPASAAGKERAALLEEDDRDDDDTRQQQQRTGSGCSSTSETSKGSVLSLSRSDSRVKARERARERSACAAAATASRDKDKDPGAAAATANASSAQAASFTELLTGMAVAEHKQQQQQPPAASSWQQQQQQQPVAVSAATADYIGFAQPRKGGHAAPHAFASPAPHLANIAAASIAMASPSPQHFGLASGAVTVASGGDPPHPHAEMTHFSFLQDHFMPVHAAPAPASAPAGQYNLNFSMSSGLVGVNTRGTLQSNSQPHISGHHHHQLQRLSTALEAPNIPFLFGPAAATPTTAETQFAAAFQLWNGGFHHHADMKEKGKN